MVTIIAAMAIWHSLPGPGTAPDIPNNTIVVLPFVVEGQDPAEADYLGRAFAEALVVKFLEYDSLTVLAIPEGNESRTEPDD